MSSVFSSTQNEAVTVVNPVSHAETMGLAQAFEMDWSEPSARNHEMGKPFVKILATGLVLSGALWVLIAWVISLI